jgi:DNA adenine methylase
MGKSKHLNLISYFGGKYPHLNWLLPLFPAGNYHFVDAMCGAANVALNVNYPLVTINDLNSEVVNLFEVLRTDHEALINKIYFTPFSREVFENAIEDTDCKLERAWQFFVRAQLGYGGVSSQNKHKGFGCEKKVSRSNYFRVDNWNKKLDKLDAIIEKLRGFQIEHKDVVDIIISYDRPTTIIYIDPPYLRSTRNDNKRYQHEQDDDFHISMLTAALDAKCMISISGYDNELYNDMLSGWFKHIGPVHLSNVKKIERQEVLWTNYDIIKLNGQINLFDI